MYSYDIFDTCLIRSCGKPEFVFDLMAKVILGEESDVSLRMDFSMERIQGEINARKTLLNINKEDVTIDEIYDFCDFSQYTEYSKEQIKNIEKDIERTVLFPVSTIKEEIDHHHQHGDDIVFISDMYLPYDFILQLLTEYGLYKDGDSFFLSSACNKTKRTGSLYSYIQQEKNVDYKDWVHKGDNIMSDIKIPSKLGIKTIYVNHQYTYYEKRMMDFEYSSSHFNSILMASIAKAIRNQYENNPKINIATEFIAPIYVPFVYTILDDAQKRGIKHLYFLARDSYLFYVIAKEMEHLFPSLDFHYIYVSRQSLYLPALSSITEPSLIEFFSKIPVQTVSDILEWLQIPDYLYSPNIGKEQNVSKIIHLLIQDAEFVNRLKKKREEQASLCFKYFDEQGLTRNNCAIIDLRGHRKCHKSINDILRSNNAPEVFGYYLEVSEFRIRGKGYYSLFFRERFKHNILNCRLEPYDLFEQYFSMTTQNRTKSYILSDDRVSPCFEDNDVNDMYHKEISNINQAVCKLFTKLFITHIDLKHASSLCNLGVAVYNEFSNAPSSEYLKAFEHVSFSDSKCFSTPILTHDKKLLKTLGGRNWTSANKIYNSLFPELCRFYLYLQAYGYRYFRILKQIHIYYTKRIHYSSKL